MRAEDDGEGGEEAAPDREEASASPREREHQVGEEEHPSGHAEQDQPAEPELLALDRAGQHGEEGRDDRRVDDEMAEVARTSVLPPLGDVPNVHQQEQVHQSRDQRYAVP
jgi:hypothetical protein